MRSGNLNNTVYTILTIPTNSDKILKSRHLLARASADYGINSTNIYKALKL
jgi:hypothetical protein